MDRLTLISFLSPDKLCGRFPILDELAVNDLQFVTMVWNILLALLPLLFYFLLNIYWQETGLVKWRQKISAVFLFIFWLIFFPNIAYIITDVRHLLNFCPADSPFQVCPANAWMIIFLFTYSAIGWILFYYNLKFMSGLIENIFKKFWSNIFIIAMAPIASLGVLLGLLNRLNSWDALIYPAVLARTVLNDFSSFNFFINWYIFTIFLYLLYFAGDAIFRKIKA